MRCSLPDGDLAAIIETAVTEKLARTREVPAAVKRAVSARDEDRCRYTNAHRNQCSARVRLEYHRGQRSPWAGTTRPALSL